MALRLKYFLNFSSLLFFWPRESWDHTYPSVNKRASMWGTGNSVLLGIFYALDSTPITSLNLNHTVVKELLFPYLAEKKTELPKATPTQQLS